MGRMVLPYYEPPKVPWCIVGKVTWGVVTAVKVPEYKAAEYVTKYGFTMLIRDSEFPVPIDDIGTMPDIVVPQSNPRRCIYSHRDGIDIDWWREHGA